MQTFRVSAIGGINSQKRASRDLSPRDPSDVGLDSSFWCAECFHGPPLLEITQCGYPGDSVLRLEAEHRFRQGCDAGAGVPAFRRCSPYWWPARPAPGSLVLRDLRKRVELAQPRPRRIRLNCTTNARGVGYGADQFWRRRGPLTGATGVVRRRRDHRMPTRRVRVR